MADTSDPNQWISVDFRGRIAIVEINRPDKLNALPKDGFYRLSQCLREVDAHDEVSITVLIGKGRFFSACVKK
jgi:peroxisomal 3,2-trans-enoyl-CoA isomerase